MLTAQQTTDEESILQKIVDVIVRERSPQAVILFGSRARGDAQSDSDVDLLVIEQEPFSPQRSRRKEVAHLQMALRKFPFSKDILLYSREEFEHWRHSLNHLIGRASREGKVMHGRL
ncbi:MAG: nucleotidyltransferase domain-containing protein [Gallionellaceae bacterium]|nr:nucleotidyltransferase domain-containing protein [Gallionellaceae bacterium]